MASPRKTSNNRGKQTAKTATATGLTTALYSGDQLAAIMLAAEDVALSTLTPHPRNYQQHPQDELDQIKASLSEHGWYRPIVVARGDVVLAGHGVRLAALQLGWTRGPVVRKDYDPDEARALRLLAGDNEIRHLAQRDDRALTELLRELAEQDAHAMGAVSALVGTGYDAQMLAALAMVTRTADEIADLNAAAQWVGMPEYDAGPGQNQITVHFSSDDDRDTFAVRLGLTPESVRGRKTLWYPDRERDDRRALRFVSTSTDDPQRDGRASAHAHEGEARA